jgi:hypothetical protein
VKANGFGRFAGRHILYIWSKTNKERTIFTLALVLFLRILNHLGTTSASKYLSSNENAMLCQHSARNHLILRFSYEHIGSHTLLSSAYPTNDRPEGISAISPLYAQTNNTWQPKQRSANF